MSNERLNQWIDAHYGDDAAAVHAANAVLRDALMAVFRAARASGVPFSDLETFAEICVGAIEAEEAKTDEPRRY